MELVISAVLGLVVGGLVVWLILRSRTAGQRARLSISEKELATSRSELSRLLAKQQELIAGHARLEAALESERRTSAEKIELLTKTSERAAEDLQNAFKALAADALKSNNTSFLQVAQ